MTPEARKDDFYAKELQAWNDPEGDKEIAHGKCDELVAELLEEAGYEKTAAVFRQLMENVFWYA